jgi:hypothetical protein
MVGTTVILTAISGSSFVFNAWSGSVNDSSPTVTFTIESNRSVLAIFVDK